MKNDFSLETLSSLESFKKRASYANSFFKKIGSGSSRIIYKLNDEKVLKLAKNEDGIEQNAEEYDKSLSNTPIFAKVYDVDDDNKWLIMEYASKIKNNEVKSLYGVSFDMISDCISLIFNSISSNEKIYIDVDKKTEKMYNDFVKWMKNISTDSIHFTDKLGYLLKNILIYLKENRVKKVDVMDWFTSDNWGLVKRKNGFEIVIIDMGLS